MNRSRNCFWLGEHAIDLLRDLRVNSYREPNGGAQRCRRPNAGTAAAHAGLRAQQGAQDSKAVLSRHSTLHACTATLTASIVHIVCNND
jgi:hypothetical protein